MLEIAQLVTYHSGKYCLLLFLNIQEDYMNFESGWEGTKKEIWELINLSTVAGFHLKMTKAILNGYLIILIILEILSNYYKPYKSSMQIILDLNKMHHFYFFHSQLLKNNFTLSSY